jgi:hypothetical protein
MESLFQPALVGHKKRGTRERPSTGDRVFSAREPPSWVYRFAELMTPSSQTMESPAIRPGFTFDLVRTLDSGDLKSVFERIFSFA